MNAPAETIRTEIERAIRHSSCPLTSGEVYERVWSTDNKQQVYAQIHYMKKRGLLVQIDGDDGGRRYGLPAPGLETELAVSADLDANCDVRTRCRKSDEPHYEPDAEGDDLDIGPPPAVEQHGGDEFERSSAGCCGRCAGGHDLVVSESKPATGTELARLVWKQPHGDRTRTLTLDLSCIPPRLHTNGAFNIDADLLAEIHGRIENRREAA